MSKLPGARTLGELLPAAQAGGYAVPAFAPRYRACIRPVVEAAVELGSPLIVQISQRELGWFQLRPREVRDELEAVLAATGARIPCVLHLDHSWDLEVIEAAIVAGFTSVMIDASGRPFDENVRATAEVVRRARAAGVSVEAELGRLPSADQLENDVDEQLYTVPEEARAFVEQTGCDALAVSIGTAHGVYPVNDPRLDLERLAAIRRLLPRTPLVLHGGSGLPAATVQRAIALPGGGISKLNIATDLEAALLGAMGGLERMSSRELDGLAADLRDRGLRAVREVAREKISSHTGSAGRG